MIDQREPYLCAVCQRPIHPSEGALCVVCRERQHTAMDALIRFQRTLNRLREHNEQHNRLMVLRGLVIDGVYSDWPSGSPHHREMQTSEQARNPKQVRWEVELAVLLGMMGVLLDTEGRDSWGDQYVSGWWQTGWGRDHEAA